jgi:activator of 2-hydroxyglutaryl-CoA dehydratase
MKYYIGLDAHSTTSTFAVVDEQGQCVLRETVKTSEQSLGHVIDRIQREIPMTMRSSTRTIFFLRTVNLFVLRFFAIVKASEHLP